MTVRRVVMWTLLGILGSGALTGIIVGLVLYLSADMRDLTHQFLGAVRGGRPDIAYALSSARLRARVPPAQFPQWIEAVAPEIRTSRGEWINGFSGGRSRVHGHLARPRDHLPRAALRLGGRGERGLARRRPHDPVDRRVRL